MERITEERPRAIVVTDHLDGGDAGRTFWLDGVWGGQSDAVANGAKATAKAFDDDGELYYTLHVFLSRDDEDSELDELLTALERWAGVTYVRFPRRHDLDIG